MEEKLNALQAALDLKQKELDLVMAIDEIRDSVSEPTAMMTAIANLLADRLEADLCLLFLLNGETGVAELKAINDRGQELVQLKQIITRELAHRATALDDIALWEGRQMLPDDALVSVPQNLHIAVAPIIMGSDDCLGAILLVRSQTPFTPDDVQLLETAEDQIDSAVIQGYLYARHLLSKKELETIYRIDHIRDLELPFDKMLDTVLQEVQNTIEAEMGFVMLYDQGGEQLEVRAATPHDLFQVTPHYEIINQIVEASLERAELICRNDIEGALHSAMCLPLILNDEIIGVLGVINRYGPGGFTHGDRRLLRAIGSQMDTAIFEQREKRQLRRVLGRSVDPQVMERLLASPDVEFLKGERSVLTVLYADIRGSTLLAERTDPELLVQFINDYLGQMTDVVLAHRGTLDKFVGDEVMALFGAPVPQPDHALRAVRVGLAMQAAHQTIMRDWQARGVEARPIGVGIATGELIVGEMGGSRRADYTVIGRAANLGSRICSAAEAGQVLVSQATYDLVKGSVEATPMPGQRFKGVDGEVTVYHVTRVLDQSG